MQVAASAGQSSIFLYMIWPLFIDIFSLFSYPSPPTFPHLPLSSSYFATLHAKVSTSMTDWIFSFLLETFILQNFCTPIEKMSANRVYTGQEKGYPFLIIVE